MLLKCAGNNEAVNYSGGQTMAITKISEQTNLTQVPNRTGPSVGDAPATETVSGPVTDKTSLQTPQYNSDEFRQALVDHFHTARNKTIASTVAVEHE